MPKIAILQMTSGVDPEANFAEIEKAASAARTSGAEILFTPEMSLLLDKKRSRSGEWINSDKPEQMRTSLCKLAQNSGIDLMIGSMPVAASDSKWANRAYYFDTMGRERATYDKIHMFDVDLASGESWRESNAYKPGESVVSVDGTPLGRLGLTICYDVRFPALFDALGRKRCDAISIPAAFTKPTGAAHWHILLQARAIEASAFVIAAAQVGKHEDGRETYGHSLVVDPWGEVLLDMGGEGPGLALCDIDLGQIDEVRSQLPSLANRRDIPK